MSETHLMVFQKTEDGWRGWIDAFSTTRVEAATKYEVEEALELLWTKLFIRKFLVDPSARIVLMAITLLGSNED
jgi:hypothetical protein